MQVLVAYGSRYGSTFDTADMIARRLELAGHEVDVLDAADVDRLDHYDLAIVGSGICAGFLRRCVMRLLHRIARLEPALPVAVFAQGPLATEQERPDDWRDMRMRLDHLVQGVDGLDIVDTALFGGMVDPERMRMMFAHLEPADVRDDDAVVRWADRQAQRLSVPSTPR